MNYDCHKLGGITFALSGAMFLSQTQLMMPLTIHGTTSVYYAYGIVALSGAIGGILPDIDHKDTHIHKMTRPASGLLTLYSKHRGITHYPITIVLLSALAFSIPSLIHFQPFLLRIYELVCLGVLFGLVSHIFLDMLNSAGIALFEPFSHMRFRIPLKPCFKTTRRGRVKLGMGFLKGDKIGDQFIVILLCAGLLIGSYVVAFHS